MKFTAYASSSAGNLYTIEDSDTYILVECGVSYKTMQALLPKRPTSYDGCVFSHYHGDHYNQRAADELRRRGIMGVNGGAYYKAGGSIGTIQIRSFDVKHDVPNSGFMFRSKHDGETCVFIIDTSYCPIVPKFSPTIIAIECNYARDLMKPGDSLNDRLFASHMSLTQCIETLQSWDLSETREIHLLHLSDDRSDEERFVKEVQAATGVPTYAAPKKRRIDE